MIPTAEQRQSMLRFLEAGGEVIAPSAIGTTPALPTFASTFPRKAILVGDSLTSRGAYNTTATSLVSANNVVTVTDTNHALFDGASVTIANANEEAFNGVFSVQRVISSSVFTYVATATGNGTATGSAQVINNQSFRDLNFFEIANAMIGHPYTAIINAGKPGKTLSYIAAGLARDALQYFPDVVQLQGGINDCIAAVAGQEATVLAEMKTYMAQMIQQCIAVGVLPIVHTVCPLGTSHASYTAARGQLVLKFNAWLREYCAFVAKQAILVDAWAVVVNPTDASSDWASGMSQDGSHPNAKACQAIATEMASVLGNSFYTARQWSGGVADSYATDSSNPNIILNPLFTNSGGTLSTSGGGTGTNSGTGAQLWTSTWTRSGIGTCVAALTARADGWGNDQVFTLTPTANGDQISMLSNAMAARVSQGDILVAECNLQISAIAAVSNVFFSIDWSANGITATQPCGMITGSAGELTQDFNWVLRTNPFVVPSGLTLLRIRLTVAFSGAATNVVMKFGRVSFRKISAISSASI